MTTRLKARFTSGDATAIVVGRRAALVAADAESDVVGTIEAAFCNGDSLGRLMTALSSIGFDALPAFAIAAWEHSALHVVHRGGISVRVECADGTSSTFFQPLVA